MRLNVNAKKFKEDILWAFDSPAMMLPDPAKKAFNAGLVREIRQWLLSHEPVMPESVKNCARLGIYFEQLWKYIFEQCPLFELIAHNLPVYEDKQTLGAFDFIYYCRYRRQYCHLEVAVKFYLGTRHGAAAGTLWRNWVGPGGKDRLDLKLNKMLNKQTELGRTTEGRALLLAMGIKDVTPELLIKGRLFYPLATPARSPHASGAGHLRGQWLNIVQLDTLPEFGDWQTLPRDEWLAGSPPGDALTLDRRQLAGELERRFATHPFPVMLRHVARRPGGHPRTNCYFITPEHWLDEIRKATR